MHTISQEHYKALSPTKKKFDPEQGPMVKLQGEWISVDICTAKSAMEVAIDSYPWQVSRVYELMLRLSILGKYFSNIMISMMFKPAEFDNVKAVAESLHPCERDYAHAFGYIYQRLRDQRPQEFTLKALEEAHTPLTFGHGRGA